MPIPKVFGMRPILGIFLCPPNLRSTLFLTALCPKKVICRDWKSEVTGVNKCNEKIISENVSAIRLLIPMTLSLQGCLRLALLWKVTASLKGPAL